MLTGLEAIAALEKQLAYCKSRNDWDNAAATARNIASLYDELRAQQRAQQKLSSLTL
jgi:hypothetical protein